MWMKFFFFFLKKNRKKKNQFVVRTKKSLTNRLSLYICIFIEKKKKIHINELFYSLFDQGYAKDNNKENRSTSTSISSPRSTLRRQAKANNNLLLPRCVFLSTFSCFFADCFSRLDISLECPPPPFFFFFFSFCPIWYVDFTTQRDDPSVKNSWMPRC